MKKILYIGIVALALLPAAVSAQTSTNTEFGAPTSVSYVLLAPLPCIGVTNGTTCTSGTNGSSEISSIGIQGYLLYLFKLVIALAVFLAVVMTIFGGFKYMTEESVTGKSDARETIQHAVTGLLLALASYLILYTINPDLVNLSNVAIPKLNVKVTNIAPATPVPCYNGPAQTSRSSGGGVPCSVANIPSSSQLLSQPAPALTPTNHNVNPDGSVVVPPAGSNTCTIQHLNGRNAITTSTYPCYSNGAFLPAS